MWLKLPVKIFDYKCATRRYINVGKNLYVEYNIFLLLCTFGCAGNCLYINNVVDFGFFTYYLFFNRVTGHF